jgi:tetratricopeptide (TPR) repeat protein
LQEALGSRYELGAVLGQGGMATVYRARDVKHQRDVAVKVFDPAYGSIIGVKRFQSEIAIAATLQHPGIVPLFDSGAAGEHLFYIMPLVEGESLRDRLKREAQLPLDDTLEILRDVASALDYAHTRGVVHRDIKPENIMLSGGHALVADFGIARAISNAGGERLTETSLSVGTPAYMSPEQVDSTAQIDGRADVYSLGCVAYEMLSGEPPFTGRTAQAIIARHMSERPPSLQIVRSTIPLAMQQAVERALAKLPADRYATATEFADAVTLAQTNALSGNVAAIRATSRTLYRVLGGLAFAGVAAVAGWMITHRPPTPDANKVVVFPFYAPGQGVSNGSGEQVALLIGSTLEHTEPLVWLDGQRLLRGSASASGQISAAEAARTARREGARYYMDGNILRNGDSLTVSVRLTDNVGDSLVRQESATGAVSMVTAPQLALRAVALVLPRLLPPSGRVDLSYIADRNAAAVADWLQGEREYARGQYTAAMNHMNRALEKDSAMGVAALKGAQAAGHLEDEVSAKRLVDIALQLDHQLPHRHLALARGMQFYLAGNADSALAAFRVAHAADTAWSEPQFLIGETFLHLMPQARALDSLAEDAFAAAVRRNPSFTPALYHLTEAAALRGDTKRARDLLASFRRIGPDSDWTLQLDLTVRCAANGPDGIDWRSAVHQATDRVVNVSRVLGAGARFPACSRRAQESVLAFNTGTLSADSLNRWSALKGLDYQLTAEGRDQAVVTMLDSVRDRGLRAAVSLFILDAAAGSRMARAHADSAMIAIDTFRIATMNPVRVRYSTLWAFFRGDRARLDSIVRRSRFIADSTHRGQDILAAECGMARLAIISGDTATAVRLLLGLRMHSSPGALTYNFWESAASERLLLAELLLATGKAREAIDVAQLFDTPRSQIHLLYLPASLEVRIRAAERLGSAAERDRYRARLAAIREPTTS